jgi:hypothetical protein
MNAGFLPGQMEHVSPTYLSVTMQKKLSVLKRFLCLGEAQSDDFPGLQSPDFGALHL